MMADQPLSSNHHRIKSIAIVGGFLDGQEFDFCDGLNCFIGAGATGKTTVLELVGFALSQPAQPRTRSIRTEANREFD